MPLLGDSVRPGAVREPIPPVANSPVQAQGKLVDFDRRVDDIVRPKLMGTVDSNFGRGASDHDDRDIGSNRVTGRIRGAQAVQQLVETQPLEQRIDEHQIECPEPEDFQGLQRAGHH